MKDVYLRVRLADEHATDISTIHNAIFSELYEEIEILGYRKRR